MKKKRSILIGAMLFSVTASFADSGLSGLEDASQGVSSFIPVVQGICYAIAAIIAIVGAVSVYLSMHNNQGQTTKRIGMTIGSALCFVCLALSLPQFFGYDSTGSTNSGNGGFRGSPDDYINGGFLSSEAGGISKSSIITTIPSLNDPREHWIHFPDGTNMRAAEHLTDIYNHLGAGSPGSYGRTLDYLDEMYKHGAYSEETYAELMRYVGNLLHN